MWWFLLAATYLFITYVALYSFIMYLIVYISIFMDEVINALNKIRSVFNLSMEQIADLLYVDRCNVYSYLDGVKPSTSCVGLINRLYKIALYFEEAQISRLDSFITRQFLSYYGLTELLLDLLQDEELDLDKMFEAINYIKDVDTSEAIIRKMIKGNGIPFRRIDDVMRDYY